MTRDAIETKKISLPNQYKISWQFDIIEKQGLLTLNKNHSFEHE